ncbi:MAG: hypothetical protein GX432_03755 [Candidatus Atribacteria bacterium]|nr:hypothetical protein [Candidatus Atribacteria bacterium]
MNEAIFTIIGTILGFVLSEFSQIRREKSNEQKTKNLYEKCCHLKLIRISVF